MLLRCGRILGVPSNFTQQRNNQQYKVLRVMNCPRFPVHIDFRQPDMRKGQGPWRGELKWQRRWHGAEKREQKEKEVEMETKCNTSRWKEVQQGEGGKGKTEIFGNIIEEERKMWWFELCLRNPFPQLMLIPAGLRMGLLPSQISWGWIYALGLILRLSSVGELQFLCSKSLRASIKCVLRALFSGGVKSRETPLLFSLLYCSTKRSTSSSMQILSQKSILKKIWLNSTKKQNKNKTPNPCPFTSILPPTSPPILIIALGYSQTTLFKAIAVDKIFLWKFAISCLGRGISSFHSFSLGSYFFKSWYVYLVLKYSLKK